MSVKKKPLVVVTRKLPDSIETRMRELFDAPLNLDDTPLTTEQIAEAVRTADVLVPTVTDEITEELLNHPDCKLKLIANFGNGVDNIDVIAAHARGITVTNTPKVLTEDTADMTMALILAVPRRLVEGASILTEGKDWPGWSPTWMLGHRIGGKRLGILGNGPHTPATFHLLSSRRLKLIRKDAFIVNTARGEVIDEDTLVKLIEAGDIGGAGRDVYENEPAVNPKLVRLAKQGKVALLPHMSSATIEGRVEMGEKVIINIRTFLDNHKPPDRVLPSML